MIDLINISKPFCMSISWYVTVVQNVIQKPDAADPETPSGHRSMTDRPYDPIGPGEVEAIHTRMAGLLERCRSFVSEMTSASIGVDQAALASDQEVEDGGRDGSSALHGKRCYHRRPRTRSRDCSS